MQRAAIIITLILFGALTTAALWHDGYVGIFALAWQSFAGAQLFADLVIALVLILIWLWQDAKKLGRNPWPWVIATFALGAFGPLIYLLTRRGSPAAPPQHSVGADLSANARQKINNLRTFADKSAPTWPQARNCA